jgi:hypothetical protein
LGHSVLRGLVLALLAADGVISAILGALFLLVYIGGVPFPISALISGVVNALLVWTGLQWTGSTRLGAIALWTWLLSLMAMTLARGPGGGVIFGVAGGPAFDEWSPLVLLVLGGVPPGIVLWRYSRGLR